MVRQQKKLVPTEKGLGLHSVVKNMAISNVEMTCNSGWKLSPVKANEWMEENMFKQYPKGDLKDTTNE